MCKCVRVHVYACAHAVVYTPRGCVCRRMLIGSFDGVGPGDRAQVVRLGGKCLYCHPPVHCSNQNCVRLWTNMKCSLHPIAIDLIDWDRHCIKWNGDKFCHSNHAPSSLLKHFSAKCLFHVSSWAWRIWFLTVIVNTESPHLHLALQQDMVRPRGGGAIWGETCGHPRPFGTALVQDVQLKCYYCKNAGHLLRMAFAKHRFPDMM